LKLLENQKLKYSEPAYYSISVSGNIHEDQLEIIMNFFTGEMICKSESQTTCLEGCLKDQIALSGLLDYLSYLHYPLIAVVSQIHKEYNTNTK